MWFCHASGIKGMTLWHVLVIMQSSLTEETIRKEHTRCLATLRKGKTKEKITEIQLACFIWHYVIYKSTIPVTRYLSTAI